MYYDKIVANEPNKYDSLYHWRTPVEYFSIRCFSRLMMDRIIFLGTGIDDKLQTSYKHNYS
jgi:hypothetical protein